MSARETSPARTGTVRATLLWLCLVAALAVFALFKVNVTTDISAFLGDEDSEESLLREVVHGELGRRMVLTIEAPDVATAIRASRTFEALLRQDTDWMEGIADLSGGPEESNDEIIWRIFQPARLGYLASTAEQARALGTYDALRRQAAELRSELQRPMSPLISQLAPEDPFLTLPRLFEALADTQSGNVIVRNGRFLTEDERYAVLFLQTRADAFDTRAQAPILEGIEGHFETTRERIGAPLDLQMSGLQRLALVSEATIRSDITRISILSAIGLSILLLVVFRSPRIAWIAAASVVTGVLCALTVTTILYGRVHGITLAFGASLLGLIVDYVVHLYAHHLYARGGEGPRESLKALWPALVVASSTALVGFGLLGATDLPGLREVAVFAMIGLLSSLLTLRWVAYRWLPQNTPESLWRERVAEASVALIGALRHRPRVVHLAWFLIAATALAGLSTARWSDDIVALEELAPELMAEENEVRARISRLDQTRFIVARGATNEAALQVTDRVSDRLRDADYIADFRSISSVLPSSARQHAVAEAFVSTPELRENFRRAFDDAGFRVESFAPFYATLETGLESPVDYERLADSPLADLVSFFRVEAKGEVLFLTFLSGVSDPQALADEVDQIEGATLVDQSALLSSFGARHLVRSGLLLGLGVLSVFLILLWRYRSSLRALAVLAPSLLAVLTTWGVLSLLGYALNLLVLAASLMIISLGVDYGVVLQDADTRDRGDLRGAMVGVTCAAATTLLGFGLLALSEYPLLHHIGMTATIGILAALLLAPLALAGVTGKPASTESP